MKKSTLLITISDGWAYRYVFSSGAIECLIKKYDITLMCSEYYFNLLKKRDLGFVSINLLYSPKAFEKILLSSLNFLYRNSFNNAINKFYISKYKILAKACYFILLKWHIAYTFKSFKKVLIFLLKFRIKYFYRNYWNEDYHFVLFLSPYSYSEIILNQSLTEKSRKYFILPSWDNIYKYNLLDFFDKYIVWGEEQKEFMKTMTAKPVIVLGSIGQYAVNNSMLKYSKCHTGNYFVILYATVTDRIFKNELAFLAGLAKMVESNLFGEDVQLKIRPHPADKNISFYASLSTERVTLSDSKSGTLDKWEVDHNFYNKLVNELLNSDLVINVASTMTIDAILVNKFVINILPVQCQGDANYYNFQHYLPITLSNLVPIIYEYEIEKIAQFVRAIKEKNTNIIFNQTKSIKSLIKAHDDLNVSNYFEAFIS